MQLNSGKLTQALYTAQRNVPWLTLAYLAAVVIVPVGLHTDCNILMTRVDMLLSFLPE